MNNITIVIIAFISAVIGSLISPLVNWGIEKKKIKLQDKRNTIEELRNLVLNEYEIFQTFIKEYATVGKSKIDIHLYPDANTYFDVLNKHSIFHKIKPYLTNETISILKKSKLLIVKDRGSPFGQLPKPFADLLENLSEIEKDWKLI